MLSARDKILIATIGKRHAAEGRVSEPATACARIACRSAESYSTLPADLRAAMEAVYQGAATEEQP